VILFKRLYRAKRKKLNTKGLNIIKERSSKFLSELDRTKYPIKKISPKKKKFSLRVKLLLYN